MAPFLATLALFEGHIGPPRATDVSRRASWAHLGSKMSPPLPSTRISRYKQGPHLSTVKAMLGQVGGQMSSFPSLFRLKITKKRSLGGPWASHSAPWAIHGVPVGSQRAPRALHWGPFWGSFSSRFGELLDPSLGLRIELPESSQKV